jgi:hypothetical protein
LDADHPSKGVLFPCRITHRLRCGPMPPIWPTLRPGARRIILPATPETVGAYLGAAGLGYAVPKLRRRGCRDRARTWDRQAPSGHTPSGEPRGAARHRAHPHPIRLIVITDSGDPVRQRLRPDRFRKGVAGSPQHGDEDLGPTHLSSRDLRHPLCSCAAQPRRIPASLDLG